MSRLTPRAAFIKNADLKRLAAFAWDAMMLASTHDPDMMKWFGRCVNELIRQGRELQVMQRQLERLGAPQYRVAYKGKKVR